jgi:hypothetical protein
MVRSTKRCKKQELYCSTWLTSGLTSRLTPRHRTHMRSRLQKNHTATSLDTPHNFCTCEKSRNAAAFGRDTSTMQASRSCIAANNSAHRQQLHGVQGRSLGFPCVRLRAAVAAAAATFPEQQQHSVPQQTYKAAAQLQPELSLPQTSPASQLRQQEQQQHLQQQQLPRHVAIIMDGNSRWAAARGLPAWVGHERGVAALRAAVLAAREAGIPALTVSPATCSWCGRLHACIA